MKKQFASTKTYVHGLGLSCCFRQWRAASHCSKLHGYSFQVSLEFRCSGLDINGWCVDFGQLKEVKQWLCDLFDHKTHVAKDDPEIDWYREGERRGLLQLEIVERTGCEAYASLIAEYVQTWCKDHYDGRAWLFSVEVREHDSNSAKVYLNV